MGGLESIKQTMQSTGSRIQAKTSEFVRQEVPAAKQKLAESTRKGRARLGSTVREELTRFKMDRKGDLDKCKQEWSRARTSIGAKVRNAFGTVERDPSNAGSGSGDSGGSGGSGGGGDSSLRFRPDNAQSESESESEEILFGTSDPPSTTNARKDSTAVIPENTRAVDCDDENHAAANPASSTRSEEGGNAESEPEMDPTKDASTEDEQHEHEQHEQHEHEHEQHEYQHESSNRPRCETSRHEDRVSNPAPRHDSDATTTTAAAATEDVPAITCQDDELVEIGNGDHTTVSPHHLFNSWVVIDEDECGA